MAKQLREITDTIIKDQAYMEFPLQIKRQYGAPLDGNEIWYDLEALKQFAKNGATKYVGETVKFVDENQKTVTSYEIGFGGTLIQKGSAEHTHQPSEIIETPEKKFVSDTEKNRWNDTYTKAQTDEKLKTAIGGLAFKGTFGTLADLPSKDEAQDGWFAIVVNEPTAKGKNVLVIFESTTKEWKQLGDLLVPGVATEDLDGLMGKDMVKALNKAGVDIEGLKDGSLLPKASSTQLGAVKQGANITIAEDGTISTHAPYEHPANHAATMITEDAEHRFVTDTEKGIYADKYTKAEADGKVSTAITASEEKVTAAYTAADSTLEQKVTAAYKAADEVLDGKITALGTAVRSEFAAADTKLKGEIDTAYKAADEQIKKDFAAADTALDAKLTKAFGDADAALKTQIEKDYAAADKVIDDKVTAMDTAYKAEDTKIRSEFATADTALEGKVTEAYKAADAVIDGKVTTLTQTHATDKAALEKQIQDVDAKFVAASDTQIDALFA